MSRLFRWYRILATGIGFLVFGIGLFAFSLLLLCTPRRRVVCSSRRKQKFASSAMSLFLDFLRTICVIDEVEYEGRVHLPDENGYAVIANHPTLLDPVFMMAVLGPVDCIVKDKHTPFFGILGRWLHYIPDQSSTALFEQCVERIEQKRNLLLFPEQTRSPEGGLQSFSRVPAQVCLASDCLVIPVLIECNHHAFGRDQSWYEVPPDPLRVRVTFFDPYRPEFYGRFSEQSRKLTDQWETIYRDFLPVESLGRD